MKYVAICTDYYEIEADSEQEAYEIAGEMFRQSFSPDSIEIEPDEDE